MLTLNGYAATTRFGLGPRPEEIDRANAIPIEWLASQIHYPQITSPAFVSLHSTSQATDILFSARTAKKEGKSSNLSPEAQAQLLMEQQKALQGNYIAEVQARLAMAITTPTPFYERLVYFWSNHFAVSVKKGGALRALAGAYEREAIRPYVTGHFVDMLLAVERHPAMLAYLDNAQSVGPNSIAGQRQQKGLNENLAREIMELHTLGVNAGYTQTDVTNFAKIITGWTVTGANAPQRGTFVFMPRWHEPGMQTVFGKNYTDTGELQGVAVLRDLAAHPATARHIATKLARHFISDTPPQDAVDALAQTFLGSGGNLPDVYDTLLRIPAAWNVTHNVKIKSGYDLVVSAARACSQDPDALQMYPINALRFLGSMPWQPDSPAGESDVAANLAGPDALVRRAQWAPAAAVRLAPRGAPLQLAADTIGPVLNSATKNAIADAKNDRESFAILFASPEFQRR